MPKIQKHMSDFFTEGKGIQKSEISHPPEEPKQIQSVRRHKDSHDRFDDLSFCKAVFR